MLDQIKTLAPDLVFIDLANGERTYVSTPMDIAELRRSIEMLVGDA